MEGERGESLDWMGNVVGNVPEPLTGREVDVDNDVDNGDDDDDDDGGGREGGEEAETVSFFFKEY